MTCSDGAMDWMRMIGWLGSYVPGTANSKSRHMRSFGDTYCNSKEVSCQQEKNKQTKPMFYILLCVNLISLKYQKSRYYGGHRTDHSQPPILQLLAKKHCIRCKPAASISGISLLSILDKLRRVLRAYPERPTTELYLSPHLRQLLRDTPEYMVIEIPGLGEVLDVAWFHVLPTPFLSLH